MKKIILIIFAVFSLSLNSCDLVSDLLGDSESGLSNEDIVAGLKTALEVGTDSSANALMITDGYYKGGELIKILLPPEADPIFEYISLIPGGDAMVEDVILGINRSAEGAAKEVKPIFKDAITNMTIEDGMNILNGVSASGKTDFDSTAATVYLKTQTYSSLVSLYAPKIGTELDREIVNDVSTNNAWTTLTSHYNSLVPPSEAVNTELGTFATEKALNGLFYKIGEEEKKIRKDPYEWAIDIIKKVFGSKVE